MAIRGVRIVWALLSGLAAIGLTMGGQTAASASARMGASVGDGVEVSIGTFVVERGARLAVEITREDPCVCLCDAILVTEFVLLESSGDAIRCEAYDVPVDAVEWLGRLSLTEVETDVPLPEGSYTLRIETSVGTFSAAIEAVAPSAVAASGRFSASASVCGLELRVYRLVTQEDRGVDLALRVGDRLMVALAGNATTGYQWENALLYEYAVLRESEEMEYRAKPHPQEMVGSGGEFLFRYEAVDVGPQAFRFIYRRPWESVDPEEIVEFTATVN